MNAAQNSTSIERIRWALHRLYSNDQESSLQATLVRVLSDPLRPIDEKGRWKPNSLLILLTGLLCALVSIFLYFSLRGAR